MASTPTRWPDGLNDFEALQRLRAIALAACEGTQDIANDRQYKALRSKLRHHSALRGLSPEIINSANSLPLLCKSLAAEGDRKDRRDYVQKVFEPLIAFAQKGDWSAPARSEKVSSTGWTGIRSISQQAIIVRRLAPAALEAVDRLIDEQMRMLDNGGPVDAEQKEAIARLRELHTELGELIRIAEAGGSLDDQLNRLAGVRDRTLRALAENLKLDTTALSVSASSLGVAIAVIGVIELFAGSSTALALGTMAGTIHGAVRAVDRGSKEHRRDRK